MTESSKISIRLPLSDNEGVLKLQQMLMEYATTVTATLQQIIENECNKVTSQQADYIDSLKLEIEQLKQAHITITSKKGA